MIVNPVLSKEIPLPAVRIGASGVAPAKTILFGEHAVVYGEPGIAIPLWEIQTSARLLPFPTDDTAQEFRIVSESAELDAAFSDLSESNPLKKLIRLIQEAFSIPVLPDCILEIQSAIPIASGLGSGAAASVAIIRAFAAAYGLELSDEKTSELAFEIEKCYHGMPSGLDNTTISFGKPLFFRKGKGFEPIHLPDRLRLIVADSGLKSVTSEVVADVRASYHQFAPVIREIGQLVRKARTALENGDLFATGALMNENHRLLQKMTVSNEKLDDLAAVALQNGAIGAKLTGAGRGGNLLALAETAPDTLRIHNALEKAGARIIR